MVSTYKSRDPGIATWASGQPPYLAMVGVSALVYRSSKNLKRKVLDFVQFGGPILTIDRTIFELWLGAL